MSEGGGTCEYVLDPDDPETWGGEEGDECYVDEEVLNEDGVWNCPHYAERGEKLCTFHLPVKKKDEEIVIERFREAIAEGKYQFLGAEFEKFNPASDSLVTMNDRYLDFSHASFHGKIDWNQVTCEANIRFRGVEFSDQTEFRGSRFDGIADFRGSSFIESVSFGVSKFNKRVNFQRAEFKSHTSLRHSEFNEKAVFSQAIFRDNVDFEKTTFDGIGLFTGTTFSEVSIFRQTAFGSTDFSHVVFNAQVSYNEAIFDGIADFQSGKFGGGAEFKNVEFVEKANFRDTTFNGITDFADTTFDGKADFRGVLFKDEVYFSNPTEYQISTQDSTLEIDSRGAKFNNKCLFNNSTFDGFAYFSPIDSLAKSNFENASFIEGVDFQQVDLTDAVFVDARLQNANFESVQLNHATLFGADLRGSLLTGALLGDARVDDDTKFLGSPSIDNNENRSTIWDTFEELRSKQCCVYDPKYGGSNKSEDIDSAKSVYRALEELAGRVARPQLQSKCFVRRQDLQQRQHWDNASDADNSLEWLINVAKGSRAKVARVTLLYGESPWRVIAYSLGIILGFALLFPLGGWMKPEGGDPITYAQIASNPMEFLNSVYYSTLTFTALGFGDFKPVGFGRALTTVETGLGAVLIALLVFVLGRRAAR